MMTSSIIATLIAGTFVGGAAGYLGSLMIIHRMALVGDALGHVALPGMALALLLHLDPSLGAFCFLSLGTIMIWRLRMQTDLSLETLVGITFVSSLALGFMIMPQPELLESLIGDISRLSMEGTLASVLISLVIFELVRRLYPGMMLLTISEDLAFVEGISRTKYTFIFLVAIALIVSLGIKITGSLLVGALVIIPPATARALSSNLKQYICWSIFLGVVTSAIGILISASFHLLPGPMIVLTSSIIFLASAALKHSRVP